MLDSSAGFRSDGALEMMPRSRFTSALCEKKPWNPENHRAPSGEDTKHIGKSPLYHHFLNIFCVLSTHVNPQWALRKPSIFELVAFYATEKGTSKQWNFIQILVASWGVLGVHVIFQQGNLMLLLYTLEMRARNNLIWASGHPGSWIARALWIT